MSELGPSPLMAGDLNLSVAQARATIAAALTPITASETVGLTQALGRVLAADVISPIAVPAHDNSAMDGYAFAGAALVDGGVSRFSPIGTAFAGAAFEGEVGAGQCVRIMTGAVMPAGCDTVVPQELCSVAPHGAIAIEPGVIRRGENRRKRGEDLALGGCALPAGRVIRPVDLGLVASLGITSVTVKRRLRVALFSTGNELRSPDQPLDDGCIYDSNRYSLMGALQRLGMEVVDLGLVRDDPAALQATLDAAVAQADVVLTSGGVSVGEADYTRTLLASMGEVAFWKVAMRPGRPFAFGPLHGKKGSHDKLGVAPGVAIAPATTPSTATAPATQPTSPATTSWLFALPGNPVAALVTFYVFAREALLQLAGATPEPLVVLQARSPVAIRKRPGRSEFQRGRVSLAADGVWQVEITGSQGAGILRSMSEANCLVVLGHDQGSVAAGDSVDVWLFDGLV